MNDPRVESAFNAALEKGSGVERAAYLDGVCADDPDLRLRVDMLLKAHEEAGKFLRPPPTEDNGLGESPGGVIGRYKLLQEIGEGGFGIVYMAEQVEPVRRKVALKIIKLGMDTKQVVARFETERQALALMDHPNIARVLDAGATDSGRPYFVMELVRGIPITDYCDQNSLSARERLRLFIAVCQAIQHAHQKGIIHRDLKPTNVLVTLHDGTPVPKVIDFGIAKATNQRLTEKTLFTEFKQFIGTPQYMSPEQAEMSGLDIDTRSDIYSLGVLLYELLTGTTPFEAEMLQEAGHTELQRIIREQEPPTPSARVSTMADVAEIAKHRNTEPDALSSQIRGDLDWIVMKALEKDRTRRYETSKELAADVERHLRNEPVLASPPSTAYKLRKFMRRNRASVITGGAVAAALVFGLALATAGFFRANREAAHSQDVADFLQEMLTSVDPQEAIDRDIDVASVSERARELFGDDHATVAATLSSLALQLHDAGKLDDAEPLYREALRIRREQHGDRHVSVGIAMTRIGKLLQDKGDDVGAERALREGLELTKDLPGRGRFVSCDTRYELAVLLMRHGKWAESEALLRETVRLRREQGSVDGNVLGATLENLLNALTSQGKYKEAEQVVGEMFQAYASMQAPDSLRAGSVNAGCGNWFRIHGMPEKGEPYFREAIRIFRLHDNPPRDLYLVALDGMLTIMIGQEDNEEVVPMFRETMENMQFIIGPKRELIPPYYFGFAKTLQSRGRDADAIVLLIEGIEIARDTNDEWEDAQKRMNQLAEATRRVAVAAGLTSEQYKIALTGVATLKSCDSSIVAFDGLTGMIHYRLGSYQEATQHLKPRDATGDDASNVLRERTFLAMTQFRLDDAEAARGTLAEAREMMTDETLSEDETNRAVVSEAEALISPSESNGS